MRTNLPITQVEHEVDDGAFIVSTTNPQGIITSANDEFIRLSGFSLMNSSVSPTTSSAIRMSPQPFSRTCGPRSSLGSLGKAS